MTGRRGKFFETYLPALKRANITSHIQQTLNQGIVRSTYLNSKICLIVHSYAAESGGEYHRLSEVAPMGCILVMEEFMDIVGRKEYQYCGGVIAANYSDIASTIFQVLVNEAKTRDNAKYVQWWKAGIRWNEVLTTIFPSSN
jgi:hypothetical protein